LKGDYIKMTMQVKTNPRAWIRAAGIRALKTMAQTFIAMCSTAAVIADVDWKYVASAVILSGMLSIATSLAGLPEVPEGPEA